MEKTYTVIPDFLLDYDLSLVETVALSVIYGFCQDGKSDFHGSYTFLARKTKLTRRGIMKVISRLESRGLITKKTEEYGGVKSCSMRTNIGSEHSSPVVNTVHRGGERRSLGGSEHGSPNNIIIENIREKKDKPISFSFLNSLMALGVSEETARDWMQVRKEQHAVNTKTAFDRIKREIDKSGKSAEECIRTAVEKSWRGFEASWMPKAPKNLEYFGDIEGFINARKKNGTNAQ